MDPNNQTPPVTELPPTPSSVPEVVTDQATSGGMGKKIMIVVIVVIILVALAGGGYFLLSGSNLVSPSETLNVPTQSEPITSAPSQTVNSLKSELDALAVESDTSAQDLTELDKDLSSL